MFERPVYTVDWLPGGGGLGKIVAAGADGKIVVWDIVRPRLYPYPFTPRSGAANLAFTTLQDSKAPGTVVLNRVTAVEDAHGDSDVNCISFCRLRVSKRALAASDDEADSAVVDTGDEDPRWSGAKGLLATAGDEGTVKVWRIVD
jgi:WD40 repeat protein